MARKGKERINRNDLVGERIGQLVVVEYDKNWYDATCGGDRLRHSYICRCDCGTVKSIRRCSLKNNAVQSCGCIRRVHKIK